MKVLDEGVLTSSQSFSKWLLDQDGPLSVSVDQPLISNIGKNLRDSCSKCHCALMQLFAISLLHCKTHTQKKEEEEKNPVSCRFPPERWIIRSAATWF